MLRLAITGALAYMMADSWDTFMWWQLTILGVAAFLLLFSAGMERNGV